MPSKSAERRKRKRFQQGRRTASGQLGHAAVIEQFVGLQRFFQSTPNDSCSEWTAEHLKRLKRARVYTVDPALYTHLYEETHETMMREVFGMSPLSVDEASPDAVEELASFGGDIIAWINSGDTEAAAHLRSQAKEWGDAVRHRSASVERFNVDHLPFRHTYFGYDDGIVLDRVDLVQRFDKRDLSGVDRVWMLGHLFSADGTIVEFFRTDVGFGYGTVREPDGWKCGDSLMPVILTNLLETVHGLHTTYVTQVAVPKTHRKGLKRVAQEVIPEEFYLVRIRPKHITVTQRTKDGDEETPQRKLAYRRDRAGHVRCLFKTDKLPLDPALKRSLVERGYSVYEDYRPVAPQHMAYAIERGKPLRQPGYWWAILVTHVQEHQFPSDPSLPYRPANRLVQ